MPELVERYWTAEDVRALPEDGNRHECVDGVLLVTPAPSFNHGYAVEFLRDRLRNYVRTNELGQLFSAPADLEIVPGSIVQPDLFVAQSASGARIRMAQDIAEVVLTVEVLSPSTAKVDREGKRRFYQRAGVGEYWIVDLDARVIERWTPAAERAEILSAAMVWRPRGASEALEFDIASYCEQALDD